MLRDVGKLAGFLRHLALSAGFSNFVLYDHCDDLLIKFLRVIEEE